MRQTFDFCWCRVQIEPATFGLQNRQPPCWIKGLATPNPYSIGICNTVVSHFSWTPQGILLELVEAFAYGLVSGLVYAPIYNWFNVRGSYAIRR